MTDAAAGQIIGAKYSVLSVLGRGTTGSVYAVWRDDLQRRFALKRLEGAQAHEQRFEREARALGQLKHPHVVDVVDFGRDEHDGAAFLVMEYLEGQSLAQRLRAGALDPDQALVWLEQIAGAVDHAHTAGILHRDLKPENVMLCPAAGGALAAKVLDFGLARLAGTSEPALAPGAARSAIDEARLTQDDAFVGTPTYAAPETVLGPGGERAADIYSLATMAYELLVGRTPFEGTVAEVLAAQIGVVPPEPGTRGRALPADVWSALQQSLDKRPGARAASAQELIGALTRGYSQERGRQATRLANRRRAWAAVASIGLLGAMLLSASRTPAALALERRAEDLLLATLPPRAFAPQLLLVALDDEALGTDARPLAEQADTLAAGVESILQAGARAVVFDLLLPATWARSNAFATLLLRHPERVALAALASPDGHVIGPEALPALVRAELGEERSARLFGFVNVRQDSDGVVRHAQQRFLDDAGHQRPSLAAQAARHVRAPLSDPGGPNDVRLDGRVASDALAKVSWTRIRDIADREPFRVQDRVVIVGGEFAGSGDADHRIVERGRQTSVTGLVLQGLLADACLQPRKLATASVWPWLLGWTALSLWPLLPGSAARRRWAGAAIVAACILSALLFVRGGALLPLGRGLATILLGGVLAAVARAWIERRA